MTSSRMRRSPSSIWPSERRMGFMVSINSVCINQTQTFVPRKWKTQVLHSCTTYRHVQAVLHHLHYSLLKSTELLVFSLLHHATSHQPMFLAHAPPKNLSSIRNRLDPIRRAMTGPVAWTKSSLLCLYISATSPSAATDMVWPCLNMS